MPVSYPVIKSPLRYPGGKTKAVPAVMSLVPVGVKELCSPFFGGGSVELACTARGIQVHGFDAFAPLVNFWQTLLSDLDHLVPAVRGLYPLGRESFYALQRQYDNVRGCVEQAAVFFVLNRCSFSGSTFSGGMSPGHPRFTESAIQRLEKLDVTGLTVELASFEDSIARYPDTFLYLDPPYVNRNFLYGKRGDLHRGFSHERLANILNERSGWLLSYNDCDMVRDLYARHTFHDAAWLYGMNNNRYRSSEVLIRSAE